MCVFGGGWGGGGRLQNVKNQLNGEKNEVNTAKGKQPICKHFKSAVQSARRVHQGRGVYFKSAVQSVRRVHQGRGVGREGDPPHCARDPAAIVPETLQPLFSRLFLCFAL